MSSHFRHTIRFHGSTNPQGRYQLQISEIGSNGYARCKAQWNFPTLKTLILFLKKYFPHSEALISNDVQAVLGFDTVPSMAGI
ncbi:hypothetical protein JOY44_02545 [Phormidium sp. CLA17]|uniref:hypothetical protein n=1 Tax=Leptolyngbya sp. Cla-17 TaxID=2803751 RepID=UPI0014919B64|nr:hypothetical protein [Leptolyngbya sp. Cla-17]MBM0740505.1 hypothetical protein [Leptolyngbya sp. Cla-17]